MRTTVAGLPTAHPGRTACRPFEHERRRQPRVWSAHYSPRRRPRRPLQQHVTRPLASASRRGSLLPARPAQEEREFGDFLRGWQHRAALASDKRALDLHLSYIDAASRALLLSQAAPHVVRAFTVVPTSAELMVPSPLFRVLLLRHLRLPLPVAPRTCACRGRLDPLGDHTAACATSGVLASRALPLERAVASRPQCSPGRHEHRCSGLR